MCGKEWDIHQGKVDNIVGEPLYGGERLQHKGIKGHGRSWVSEIDP